MGREVLISAFFYEILCRPTNTSAKTPTNIKYYSISVSRLAPNISSF